MRMDKGGEEIFLDLSGIGERSDRGKVACVLFETVFSCCFYVLNDLSYVLRPKAMLSPVRMSECRTDLAGGLLGWDMENETGSLRPVLSE